MDAGRHPRIEILTSAEVTALEGEAGAFRATVLRRPLGVIPELCTGCGDCAKVCPVDALSARPGGGVRLKNELCIGCGNCARACPFGAIFWDDAADKPLVCVYCGYCAGYCPYGVIALEDMEPEVPVER